MLKKILLLSIFMSVLPTVASSSSHDYDYYTGYSLKMHEPCTGLPTEKDYYVSKIRAAVKNDDCVEFHKVFQAALHTNPGCYSVFVNEGELVTIIACRWMGDRRTIYSMAHPDSKIKPILDALLIRNNLICAIDPCYRIVKIKLLVLELDLISQGYAPY